MTSYPSNSNKRILLVHRYYYPDTPAYASMLKKIAERLSFDNKVEVLSSFPSYYGSTTKGVERVETINNVNVTRIRLFSEKNRKLIIRLINTFLFSFIIFFKICFRKKYDLITVATTPPIIVATVIRFVSFIKGNRYLYHCQDIYPEIAFYNGNLRSKTLFRLLRFIDKYNNINASSIVVLSKDMKNTLIKERGIKPSKISIVNNFIRSDINNVKEFSFKDYGISSSDFIITFCGNIGKLQNLNILIDLAKQTKDFPNIKYVFIGEGLEKDNLKLQAGRLLDRSIYFLGYLNSDIAINALLQSDLGVVSISEPTYRTAYPSKTMTYLNAGLPILAFIDKSSELADFIVNKELGILMESNNIQEMKITLIDFFNNKERYDSKKIQEIAQKEFGEFNILNKWEQLIKRI